MWEQVKRAMVDGRREVCGSVWIEGKILKNVWSNDMVKAAVERKEAAGKDILGARGEITIDRCMKVYKEEKRKGKRCIYHSKNR